MSATQSPEPILTTRMPSGLLAETVWGTPVTPTAALGSVKIVPSPKISLKEWTARGYRLPTAASLSEKSAELAFEGMASYTELANFCKSIGSAGVVTVDSYSVAAGGKIWPGAAVSAWSLKGNNESVDLSGSMLAKWFSGAAGALSSAPDQDVIDQSEIVLKLGGVTLDRYFDWSLDVSEIINMVRFAGSQAPGAVTCPESLKIAFAVSFEKNTDNAAFIEDATIEDILDWEIDATKVSPAHTLVIQGRGRIAEIKAFDDTEGVYGYGVTVNTLANATNAIVVVVT